MTWPEPSDWAPLEMLARARLVDLDSWMIMHAAVVTGGTRVSWYKHRITREHVIVDEHGHTRTQGYYGIQPAPALADGTPLPPTRKELDQC